MGQAKIAILFIIWFLAGNAAQAQQAEEAQIRQLENAEREAILKGDTARLSQLMSPNIVVHNPENTIVGYAQIVERIQKGMINYDSFERLIERVSFFDNTAVVMGKETIKPKGTTKNAGKTVTRRFTNIWLKDGSTWRLIARQSTIVSVK